MAIQARGLLLPALLIGSVSLSALLALQAYAAGAYHRRGAEQVLRDFARLAGTELARRAAAGLGYDGYMVALESVAARAAAGWPQPPVAARDEREARAAGLVAAGFVVDPASGRASGEREPPPELLAALRAAPGAPRPFLVSSIAGETFVVGPSSDPRRVTGFALDAAGVAAFLRAALARGPLLPPSLGQGQVANDALALEVRDPGGLVRLRQGRGPWPALEVEVPFQGAYGGALDGWSARLSIDPAQAPRLVVGGLPGSRLPALLVQLALSVGLAAAALHLVRRERAVARLREEFVQSVSHELRTPLTQIRMFAETLRLGRVRGPHERERAVAVIDREARRLGQLVENILQTSRAERGAEALQLAAAALAPIVRQALEAFRPLAEAAEATLVERLDPDVVADVDADAVQQIVQNLLANAVKYGPRGQSVTVELALAGRRAELSVSDQGPGIPGAERARVFARFARLERDRASARSGTGLGLAVVADLARRHGGEAFAEATAGGGARVGVRLPASAAGR